MPELVSRLNGGLPTFPAGAGKGAIFSPLPQDIKDGVVRAHTVQTINSDPQTLYALWRKLELAPKWQEYVVNVEVLSETRSRWTFGDPEEADGKRVEYESEITADEPGKRLAWHSVTPGIDEAGEVTFTPSPAGRGTIVLLRETMKVPGGVLGNFAAGLAKRTPEQIVIEDLRHFKQLAEAGEIPSVMKNSHGPRGFIGSIKKRLHGENNPTPPGTSELA